MDLILLLGVGVALINIAASVMVLRVSAFSASQRLLQLLLIWLVPVLGSVICATFASSQALGPASSSSFDPLHLPSDGGAPDGPGIGIGGWGSGDCGGDAGGGCD